MAAEDVGLTITYNRLRDAACTDAAVVALRRQHEDLDRAVLAAYGWDDIAVPPYHDPVTPEEEAAKQAFEDEVIDRLFALNAERAQEEALLGAGTPRGRSGKKGGGRKSQGGKGGGGDGGAQGTLL
jgi:hypothetical protein